MSPLLVASSSCSSAPPPPSCSRSSFVCCLQAIYLSYDKDRSGTIGVDELPGAFRAAGGKRRCIIRNPLSPDRVLNCVYVCAGFPLNDQLYQLMNRRYSDENGNMDFDNFIGCLVRLDAMCSKCRSLPSPAVCSLMH